AKQAEAEHQVDVEGRVVDGIDADRTDDDDEEKEQAVGDPQQANPQADHRQVDDDEHHADNEHADDQAPEQVRLAHDDVGSGRDAVQRQRTDHQRHGGAGG